MYKITNNNPEKFEARYDGKLYAFPPGKAVLAEDDAVQHIFGLGEKDKTPIIARHGWAKVTDPLSVGLAVLNNFKFAPVKPNYGADEALTTEHGPAPVLSGGEEGGELPTSPVREGGSVLSKIREGARQHA